MNVILFDMDGTLVDSTPAILESFDYAFQKMGISFSDFEKIPPMIGYPLDNIFIKLGVDENIVHEFLSAYKEHYRLIANSKTSLIKNAKEAIELAYSFATIGIVTTKTSLYTKDILSHFGLLDLFKIVIGRDDVKNPKPDPEPILKATQCLNANKDKVWMVGDTILDLDAARAAGVNGIGVLCGYGKKDDLRRFTNYITDDVLHAVTLIKTFLKK